MVYKQPKSKYWWFKFTWNGELVRKSTKQTNKRVAEQIEAAQRTALAKGEVGIAEEKRAPTLKAFANDTFLTHLKATKAEEPNTIAFYRNCVRNLLASPHLSDLRLDQIKSDVVTEYVLQRQQTGISVATINRELATLRRMLRLASEWGNLRSNPPNITLLDGEFGRERVLSFEEETAYLAAAAPLLRTVVTIILDCGFRPDEVYRLRWEENYRENRLVILKGKTKAARRSIRVSSRVAALLEMIQPDSSDGWIFPAATKAGHINQSSLKKQHVAALKASGVKPFVIYDARHTCLTRWAKTMDPFTLKKLAGHESLETTMKYIHLNESDSEKKQDASMRSKLHWSEARRTAVVILLGIPFNNSIQSMIWTYS